MLLAVYVLLLGYGALHSVVRVRGHAAQVAVAAADVESRWRSLRASAERPAGVWGDWRSPSLVGGPTGFAVTWIPIEGLMALSAGESLRVPAVMRVSIYRERDEPPLENPLVPAGGLFDLAFVVQWLLPLTILVATHAAVSGDRMTGTWRLVASTTAAPGCVLAGRLLWPTMLLCGVTLIGGTVAAVAAGPVEGVEAWLRLSGWWVLVFAYALFWAIVSGGVSARVERPAQALVTTALLWLSLVWVVPGLIEAVASMAVPPTNRVEAHVAAREAARDVETRLPALVEGIYVEHPDWRPSPEAVARATRPVPGGPASRDSRRVYAPARQAVAVAAPFRRASAERRQRVESIVRVASLASPPLAVQRATDALAGTSAARFDGFAQHVADREQVWHAFFAPRIMQLRDMTLADLDAIPANGPFTDPHDWTDLVWATAALSTTLMAAAAFAAAGRRSLGR
jgi:hypothetical protein